VKPGRISLAAFVALGLLSVPVQAETIQVIVDKLRPHAGPIGELAEIPAEGIW